MKFKQITVVGVGLIGGSFALAARKAQLAERICGVDFEPALKKACELGVVEGGDEALERGGVSGSDLIYLAAPVGGIIDFLRTRGGRVRSGALVTDAGSTKREVCRAACDLPPGVRFVGGHPMAGRHESGAEFASADLFRGAPYAVVQSVGQEPADDAHSDAAELVAAIVREIGGRPVFISAERHDHVVARISHAPQMLSTALASVIARSGDSSMIELAGSGFGDMTRLAESGWSVWEDICRTNADEIAAALKEMGLELEAARRALDSRDLSPVGEAFEAASKFVRLYRETRRRSA